MTYLLLSFYWPLKCCISRRVRKFLLLFVGGGETFRLLRLLRKVNLSITATTLTQQSVPVLGEDSSAPLTEVITEFMKRWSGERGDAAGLCIRSILTRFQKQRRKKNKQKIKFNHNPMSHGSSDQSCSRLVFTAKAHYYSH